MENPTMSPGSTVMGVLSPSTVPPSPMSLNCAGIRADVMLASLQATLVPAPTNTGDVTKSPANPVEATESTATRARIERTMTVSSFGAHDALAIVNSSSGAMPPSAWHFGSKMKVSTWRDGSFQPPRRSVPRNSVPFRHRMPPEAIPEGRRMPSILLLGEREGLAAGLLHHSDARSAGPFVDVHCAAIPGTLLEAELFGFVRGAFTDARTAKRGLMEAAQPAANRSTCRSSPRRVRTYLCRHSGL